MTQAMESSIPERRCKKKIPQQCPACYEWCSGSYELNRHIGRKHSKGKKNFKCSKMCDKRFFIKVDLRDHEKYCGKPFHCNCGKVYKLKCNLKTHHKKPCPGSRSTQAELNKINQVIQSRKGSDGEGCGGDSGGVRLGSHLEPQHNAPLPLLAPVAAAAAVPLSHDAPRSNLPVTSWSTLPPLESFPLTPITSVSLSQEDVPLLDDFGISDATLAFPPLQQSASPLLSHSASSNLTLDDLLSHMDSVDSDSTFLYEDQFSFPVATAAVPSSHDAPACSLPENSWSPLPHFESPILAPLSSVNLSQEDVPLLDEGVGESDAAFLLSQSDWTLEDALRPYMDFGVSDRTFPYKDQFGYLFQETGLDGLDK